MVEGKRREEVREREEEDALEGEGACNRACSVLRIRTEGHNWHTDGDADSPSRTLASRH